MPALESPIPGFFYFEIETVVRVFYFLVATESVLMDWMSTFSMLLLERQCSREQLYDKIVPIGGGGRKSGPLFELDEAYLARPVEWKLDKRRIYNYRRIMFRGPENEVFYYLYLYWSIIEILVHTCICVFTYSQSISIVNSYRII